jgi:hypothetical protein
VVLTDIGFQDLDYIKKWYTIDMPKDVPTTLSGRDEMDRIQRGRKDFNP